jgi:hypothetical protein
MLYNFNRERERYFRENVWHRLGTKKIPFGGQATDDVVRPNSLAGSLRAS